MKFEDAIKAGLNTYVERTPKSKALSERAVKVMPGGDTRTAAFFKPYTITMNYGQGCYLYDIDGNKYIDFLNNYTSMIHGHAHPSIVERVRKVLDKGTAYATAIEEQTELAEQLVERVPSVDKVRFCNCGTEAVLYAIRAARAFTGKPGIIKMEGGFHGNLDVTQFSIAPALPHPVDQPSWTAIPSTKGNTENTAADVYIAPYNDAEAVENLLKQFGHRIAAIILEPILGQSGIIAARSEYLKALREMADRYGVLLIYDEIQTLRTSLGGIQKKLGIFPDLTAMGKFIGGGYPVSAFGGRDEIMDLFDPNKPGFLSHSGTFNGNKIGMAAGAESVRLLTQAAIDELDRKAVMLEQSIQTSITKHNIPACVCRGGSLMHVHFVENIPYDYASSKGPYNEMVKVMHLGLLNEGIFIAPRGSFNISTVMTDADISFASEKFEKVFSEMETMF